MANTHKRNAKRDAILIASLESDPRIGRACEAAGIDRSTLRRWRMEDPAFSAALDTARDHGAEVFEDALAERALEGDTTALIFALKSWRRERYGDRTSIEHTGAGGGPLILVHRVKQDSV